MPIAMISQGNRLLLPLPLPLVLSFGFGQLPDGNFHSFRSWQTVTTANLRKDTKTAEKTKFVSTVVATWHQSNSFVQLWVPFSLFDLFFLQPFLFVSFRFLCFVLLLFCFLAILLA